MTSPSDAQIFLGRRRIRGTGTRASLPAGSARAPFAADAASALLRRIEREDGVPRLIMGMIPFDPEEPAHLVIPEVLEEDPEIGDEAIRRSSGPLPGTPDDPEFRASVRAAVSAIGRGDIRKVVLSRSMTVRSSAPIDTVALLGAFMGRNPAAYGYHMATADGQVLVGASPELVADADGDSFRSLPLAGSAARTGDDATDAATRATLLRSGKDREEHALLVTALEEALSGVTEELVVPAAPTIVETDRLLHLGTPMTGRLRPGASVLSAAYAVHPTAAVCGVPVGAAAELITALEGDPRGPYAGLVGWMDSSGSGEWALALRCAVVSGSTARVRAGAGIVGGSDPDAEHSETATKLSTALAALSDVLPSIDAQMVDA